MAITSTPEETDHRDGRTYRRNRNRCHPSAPEGKVSVHGEFWNAVSDQPIEKGEKVKVIGVTQFKTEGQKNSNKEGFICSYQVFRRAYFS